MAEHMSVPAGFIETYLGLYTVICIILDASYVHNFVMPSLRVASKLAQPEMLISLVAGD